MAWQVSSRSASGLHEVGIVGLVREDGAGELVGLLRRGALDGEAGPVDLPQPADVLVRQRAIEIETLLRGEAEDRRQQERA